jgi:hypothetical protein
MDQSIAKPRFVHKRRATFVVLAVALLVGGFSMWRHLSLPEREQKPLPANAKSRYSSFGKFAFWFGDVAAPTRQRALPTGSYSNIEPKDYTEQGAGACGQCHPNHFQSWSRHPHRWMNAAATSDHVQGDFSDQTTLRYLGGKGRFWKEGNEFRMTVSRGAVCREFRITRTIGSRYFEYYVGVQTAGPEPADPADKGAEHVLPFGYWLTRRQWVPTVHIREDRADDFDDPRLNPYEGFYFRNYDDICGRCHTTLPMADWLARYPEDAGKYSPHRFGMDLTGYLKRQRPDLLQAPVEQMPTEELEKVMQGLMNNRPPSPVLHLGIVCEACHNGCKQHVADPEHALPHFFPTSPLIYAELPAEKPHGRTHANVNWICGRCHVGVRPLFPGGMSTWNSAEYSDAMRGGCYSQLRCVDCHNPHQATGPVWTHSADHDDASCLKCHAAYREAKARQEHTHHAPGSAGDRCMNCHMPRVNEGLDTVVRTHTISSPSKAVIIENNGPNACNLCHVERPIDWTLGYLRDWYGRNYRESAIARNYRPRQEPVGRIWLKHGFRATRLVAAAAYARRKNPDILPLLLTILDDKYLLNRQFGQLAVEEVSGQSLDKWGYSFLLSPDERAPVLPKVQEALAPGSRVQQKTQGEVIDANKR